LANKMRLRRSCQEIRIAAQRKEVYHLWWHPENFGDYPEQNLQSLEVLLQTYKKCKEKYDMTSWTMGEYDKFLCGDGEPKAVKQMEKILL